jgi:hypothetical protein
VPAGQDKNPAGIVVLGINLLLFLIGGIKRVVTCVKDILRDQRLEFCGFLLPGLDYSIPSAIDLLLGEEVTWVIGYRPIPSPADMAIAKAAIGTQLDITTTSRTDQKLELKTK